MKEQKQTKKEKHIISIITIEKGLPVNVDIEAESLDDAKDYVKKIKNKNIKFVIYDEHERIILSGVANEHKRYKEEEYYEVHESRGHSHHLHPNGEHHEDNDNDDDDSYA